MTTDFRALCAELAREVELYALDRSDEVPDVVDRARAALAEAEAGPSDEDILRELADIADENILVEHTGDVVDAGRRLLARYGSAPRPIPLSERLPWPEDCDAEGQCWQWDERSDSWVLYTIVGISIRYSLMKAVAWWLPAHAIPTPENTDD